MKKRGNWQKADEGQVDKGGNPYIEHPLAVADRVVKPEAKVVALLHDVLEDTRVTGKNCGSYFQKQWSGQWSFSQRKRERDFPWKRIWRRSGKMNWRAA